MNKIPLCVVIPVYNEDACILKVLKDWVSFFQEEKINAHFVIINDGSTDNTSKVLDGFYQDKPQFHIIHQENQGHGPSVLTGYHYALGLQPEYIFQVDSDDQFMAKDFRKFWDKRNDSPFINGVRVSRQDSFARKLISFIMRSMVFEWFDQEIQDPNIPYRLFESRFLKNVLYALPLNLFAPNIFISVISFAFLKDVPEIPVTHKDRQTGKVSLVSLGLLKACLKTFYQLFSFRYKLYEKLNFLENVNRNEKYNESHEDLLKKAA
jgi:dolichol-phosphate mannosyltransferase